MDLPLLPVLDLPAAPPAPGVALQRTPTMATFQSYGAEGWHSPEGLPSIGLSVDAFSFTDADTAPIVEPTIDDLKREIYAVQAQVTTIEEDLGSIEMMKQKIISSQGSPDAVAELAKTTTATGQAILSLSTPFASVRSSAETLDRMFKDGRAAATSMEVENINEEIEVVKLGVGKNVEMIRSLAWEEAQAKPEARKRLEEAIGRENPGMPEDGVQQALQQAELAASERVSLLDIASYAGRFAAEHPFTELAVLVNVISQMHAEGIGANANSLNRVLSERSRSTLQGGYEKIDNEIDLEAAPLAQNAGLPANMEEDWTPGAIFKEASIRNKIKEHWRDWLVRTCIVLAVLGLVISLITYETIQSERHLYGNSTTPADTESVHTESILPLF